MLSIIFFLMTLAVAIPLIDEHSKAPRRLKQTSNYVRLTKRTDPAHARRDASLNASTEIRPTDQELQAVVEVQFNGVARYLLIDTGSADTWMEAPEIQCLDPKLSPAPQASCKLGDSYVGPKIPQIANETYYQVYGTNEIVLGPIGYADVTVAGLIVEKQKVALVEKGFILGDGVRSGVFGLAPGGISQLFESTNASNSAPGGTAKGYSTVFEGLMKEHEKDMAPLFSLAMQRGEAGGYLAFGGLPPTKFDHEFAFTPFAGLKTKHGEDASLFYPIQPEGFQLNGANTPTTYRTIVDSGSFANSLPTVIADQVNAAFDPPAQFNETLRIYLAACNATPPTFALNIGGKLFEMPKEDMFLPGGVGGICATAFTRGFAVPETAYPDGFYALGAAFLHSVIAVFDIGCEGMRFAKHDY